MAKRAAAVLVVLAVGVGITLLASSVDDRALVLGWVTGGMLAGSIVLLGILSFANLRDVAASWNPAIAAVLISSLVIVSTSALAAGLPLGSLAALVAAVALVIVTWRAWRISTE